VSGVPREPRLPDGDRPLVSIGLPVYNGENYVAKAIGSVLEQTLRDLELVISDNASTDRTQTICEEFAQRDARVRYFRNERNLGAGPNYDQAFYRALGKYFNWLAHDDRLAPTYLEEAVACLERNPDAVLCQVGISEIGPDDEIIRVYRNQLPGVDSTRASRRFGGMILYRHECEAFFGLFRRDALIGSDLHGTYPGSDRVLLAEMALRGRCVTVPAPLFLHREHKDRYTRAVLLGDRKKAESWQHTSHGVKKTGARLFSIVIYRNYWRVVHKNVRDTREKWACYGQLARWWFKDRHFRGVVRNVLGAVHPGLLGTAVSIKRALFGASTPPGSLTRSD
jgi:glycosyltransferase involved in cell wall biosynthesis